MRIQRNLFILLLTFILSPIFVLAQSDCLTEGQVIQTESDKCCDGYYTVSRGIIENGVRVNSEYFCHKESFSQRNEFWLNLVLGTIFLFSPHILLISFITAIIVQIVLYTKFKNIISYQNKAEKVSVMNAFIPFLLIHNIKKYNLKSHENIKQSLILWYISVWVFSIALLLTVFSMIAVLF